MIAVSRNRSLAAVARKRSAFTLLEVLVVVAILIVLASVASIAVFRELDNAKESRAKLDMQALENSYKRLLLKDSTIDPTTFDIQLLAGGLEQGTQGLYDPWGNVYQFDFVMSEFGEPRIRFFTVNPKNGNQISFPDR